MVGAMESRDLYQPVQAFEVSPSKLARAFEVSPPQLAAAHVQDVVDLQ